MFRFICHYQNLKDLRKMLCVQILHSEPTKMCFSGSTGSTLNTFFEHFDPSRVIQQHFFHVFSFFGSHPVLTSSGHDFGRFPFCRSQSFHGAHNGLDILLRELSNHCYQLSITCCLRGIEIISVVVLWPLSFYIYLQNRTPRPQILPV